MSGIVRQFGKNILSSWALLGIRALLVFLVNPFIIHSLGNDRYGVWVLAVSVINYMTIMDLGLKQAILRFISKFLRSDDFGKINSYLNTAFGIYFLVGQAVILFTLLISIFVPNWFNIPSGLIDETRWALVIVGATAAINFTLLAWGDSLGAFHRFDVSNGLMIGEEILRTAAIIIILKSGYGLIPFALAYLVFNLLRNLSGIGLLKKIFPKITFNPGLISGDSARTLLHYGMIGFFISIAWLLIANTDHVLIGLFLDTTAVTKYAIAAGLVIYLRILVQAVTFPLRPVISHYETGGDIKRIAYIYTRTTQYLYLITFAAAGGVFFFAEPFMALWMGPGYELSAEILQILIIPAALFLPQSAANSVMYGMEKHKYLLYVILSEGILNLGLSLILVRFYGVFGIAYGTVIPQIIIYLAVVPPLVNAFLNFGLPDFYRRFLIYSLCGILVSGLSSYILVRFYYPQNWGVFFAEIIAVIGMTAFFGYLISNKNELKEIYSKLKS